MTITVASGKGGSGKTMLTASLAALLAEEQPVTLLDLDVEEPNLHLFFDLPVREEGPVWSMIPEIDEEHCTHCGICSDICEFNALLVLEEQVLVFPELCKGCRGCVVLCPEGAVRDGRKMIGMLETRQSGAMTLHSGRLRVSETAAPALIRAVKERADASESMVICDAPPGTSCAAVEAVRDADFVILVGEATPLGLHDLELMARTVQQLGRPFGVVINKAVPQDRSVHAFCSAESIEVLGQIPHSRAIAMACAQGRRIPEALPATYTVFERILRAALRREVAA